MTMQVSNDMQTNEFILFICKCLFFITKSEYQAAIELELWKENQEKIFENQVKII
jgi:hypothetical protein